MKRRTIALLIALPIVLVVGIPLAFFGFWMVIAGGSDAGSPELARAWRDEISNYGSPDQVETIKPPVEVVKFGNGEWLYGRAQNSHGMWRRGGGTIVIKDSKGQTHAFLGGHVCGDGFLSWGFGETADLESFFKRIADCGFHEYNFD